MEISAILNGTKYGHIADAVEVRLWQSGIETLDDLDNAPPILRGVAPGVDPYELTAMLIEGVREEEKRKLIEKSKPTQIPVRSTKKRRTGKCQ